MTYLAWPENFGDNLEACCTDPTPCPYHTKFPAAVRSRYRTRENAVIEDEPVPSVSPIITP